MKNKLRGSLFLLLATIIWGSAFVSQSMGMDHIGPFTFQTMRCLLAVAGLFVVIFIADRFKKDEESFLSRWADPTLWKAGILCGIPLFLACNLQQVGLTETSAGKSGFLTAMYIVIVPIIGIFLKKKPSGFLTISILLAVAGLYCLSFADVPQISIGDLLTICCAIMFAVQITVVDHFATRVDPLRLNAIQAAVCALLSAVVMLLTEKPVWQDITACGLPLIHAGLLSMGVAYALQILGQRDLEPAAASLIMSLESVFAVLFGWLILQESLTGWEIAGCLMMFIAVVLSQLPEKRKKNVLL